MILRTSHTAPTAQNALWAKFWDVEFPHWRQVAMYIFTTAGRSAWAQTQATSSQKNGTLKLRKSPRFRNNNAFQQQLASFLCQTWRLLAAFKTAGSLFASPRSSTAGALVPKKDSREVTQLPGTLNNQFLMAVWFQTTISNVKILNRPIETTIKNWLFGVPGWTFLTSWMHLKPSNAGQRTISAKRVSSKTLETPSNGPKNRPEIWRSEFLGIQEGDTFHPLRKRILFDSRLNLNIENQFLRNSIFNPHGRTVMDWRFEKANLFFKAPPRMIYITGQIPFSRFQYQPL